MLERRDRCLIIVGGTWEKQWGMLGAIVDATDGKWAHEWVEYPASYGTPQAYLDSERLGVQALMVKLATVWALGYDDIAIVGFSQGAAVVERGLREYQATDKLGNAREALSHVRYVALLGNPYRAAGDQVGPDPGGFGVIGPLAPKGVVPIPLASRWHNFALPGDLITSCPPDSLVRLVFPFTRWMSVQTLDRWAAEVLAKLSLVWLLRHVPELRDVRQLPRLWGRIVRATEAAYHYQTTGVHGQYMTRPLGAGKPTAARFIVQSLEEI
ncbi:lysin B [Gordonia phage Dogfish]|nr:lysin B [Gordonia phage Dogfish]